MRNANPVALVERRLADPLADAVRLRAPRLRPRMVDVLQRQVQLVLVVVRHPAVLRLPIGQDPAQRDAVLLVEREHRSLSRSAAVSRVRRS